MTYSIPLADIEWALQRALKSYDPSSAPTSSDVLLPPKKGDEIRMVSEIMLDMNKPERWFRRDGKLVRVFVTMLEERRSDTPPYECCIENNDTLYGGLVTARNFKRGRRDKDGDVRTVDSEPNPKVLSFLVQRPPKELPNLKSIVTTPYFAKGRFVCSEGYCSEDETLLVPAAGVPNLTGLTDYSPESLLKVGLDISPEGVRKAVQLIDEVFADFIFANPASRAHTFAAVLAPLVRRTHPTSGTPIFFASARLPGTGKTLLMRIISLITDGRQVAASTVLFGKGFNEGSMKMQLSAFLSDVPQTVLIDNVKEGVPVADATLASTLTTGTFQDRKVGTSHAPIYPVECNWLMTGNNPKFSAEIARRTLLIQLTSEDEHPEQRTNFCHPDILKWVTENREPILRAFYTLVISFAVDGAPRSKKPLGSYPGFAPIVGGILEHAGIEGFLENQEEKLVVENPDEYEDSPESLLPALELWWAAEKDALCLTTALIGPFVRAGLVAAAHPSQDADREEKRQLAQVSLLLKPFVNVPIGPFIIKKEKNARLKANEYQLLRSEPALRLA